jgi:hypothetical protein
VFEGPAAVSEFEHGPVHPGYRRELARVRGALRQARHAGGRGGGVAAMGARIGSISQAAQVTAARYEITEHSNTEKLVGLRWV